MKTFYTRVALIMLSLAVPLSMSSCGKDPKTFTPQSVEVFTTDNKDRYTTADKLLQADYIFVMDFGFSMSTRNKKDEFLSSLYDFVNSLRAQGVDYRIGLVNGNVHADQYSTLSSDFLGGIFIDASMSGSEQNSLLGQLNAIGRPLQKNTNLLVGSAIWTMNSQSSNFIRPGSQLVYVFVSDTDDQTRARGLTSKNNQQLADTLIAYKGSTDFVNARSIVVGYDKDGASCNGNVSYGETDGDILADVARRIEGGTATTNSVSSCILNGNFPATLDDLAKDVRTPTDHFQLQSPGVDSSTIVVYINGIDTRNSYYSFQYYPNTNSIKITPAPDHNALVEIHYEQFYKLSGSPNPDRMTVKINGTEVPRSSSNGWTYNSAYSRLEFHGTYVPHDGDKITVDYQ